MLRLGFPPRFISLLVVFGLFTPLGPMGCGICVSECVADAGAIDTDDDPTTGSAMTTVSTTTPGPAATMCADETLGGETEETEGLNCGGMSVIPDVVDMKTVRAGDLVPPPAGYSADTRFLVLRSQGSVCGPNPLAPPDCNVEEEFTLVLVLPPEFQAAGTYFFGDFASDTGFGEADIESWIHIGGTGCCETGVLPTDAHLEIESIAADGSIIGRICNFYWMPALGQGLSGYVDAPAC